MVKVIKVGDEATFVTGTDSRPGTVTMVKSEREIRITTCPYEIVGGPYEYGEDKEVEYHPREIDPEDGTIYTLRKNGRWIPKGAPSDSGYASIGVRRYYMDPSF